MKLKQTTRNIALTMFAAAVAGCALITGCTTDEFDDCGLTMAKRKASSRSETNGMYEYNYLDIPIYKNECGLWALAKLRKNMGYNFSEGYTMNTYYEELRSEARKNGWNGSGSISNTILLKVGKAKDLLNSMELIDSTSNNKDSIVLEAIGRGPKLVGKNGHIGVFDRIKNNKIKYTDYDGSNSMNYSEVVALFF